MMDETPDWIKTKLTMHEFILEVMMANNLASIPEHHSAEFKSDFLARTAKA
jgi:hypothetical protein